MTESEQADLLSALHMVAMERLEDGSFRLLGTTPEWLRPFFQSVYPVQTSFGLGENCPFLENFLIDAERFWGAETAGRLKSGLLIASSPSGDDYALEATAVHWKKRKIILLELSWLADTEKQTLIQKGRELSLDHHRLLQLEHALRKAQSDLKKRVEERTAELSRSNALLQQEIAERKRAEEHLERLATAIEQAAESIILTDRKGNVEYVNPVFVEICGYDREEIIGRNIRILRSDRHDDTFYKTMWNTIIHGNVWKGHIISKLKGGALREFETTISPLRGKSGEINSFVSVNRDVTHEVRLEQQLRQAQKMEAIGTLAGGIAHDFNNILTAILGYTELLLLGIPENSSQRGNLIQVINAGNRAKDLVQQILVFSRQSEQQYKPVQVGPIVKETIRMLRASLPSTIDIDQHIAIPKELDLVLADATLVHQILMNLCINAADAMPEKSAKLEVSLDAVEVDTDMAARFPDMNPGPYVRLTVSDTGHGMDRTVMDRIFDPFFTTKAQGKGTGLGLAVVHGIVKSLAGTITVNSEPGRGSVFQVFLPRIASSSAPETAVDIPIPTGDERILFVDDEKTLVDVGRQMLEHLGYQVTATVSSIEALEAFRTQPDHFDLVITDQTMPDLTGIELAKELTKIRPDIPIILCTGFSELITPQRAEAIKIRRVLMKPVEMRRLALIIRELLE
jgi:PAS domain S-box-containing protein